MRKSSIDKHLLVGLSFLHFMAYSHLWSPIQVSLSGCMRAGGAAVLHSWVRALKPGAGEARTSLAYIGCEFDLMRAQRAPMCCAAWAALRDCCVLRKVPLRKLKQACAVQGLQALSGMLLQGPCPYHQGVRHRP